MLIESLAIEDVKVITPKRHGDSRGFFSETYNKAAFRDHGIDLDFVQDNHSKSSAVGVLRGLHFQIPPVAQDKLVRVVAGRIYDVAVDIRHGSPTFGHWVGIEVSGDAWNQVLVPAGFAHGFVTLEPDTEVIYKVTAPYAPECDKGLAWDDSALAIDWPLGGSAPTLSAKDRDHPKLADLPAYFSF